MQLHWDIYFQLLVQTFLKSAAATFRLPSILGRRRGDCLPLQVRDAIGAAAVERDDVIFDEAGTGGGRAPC